MARHTFIETEIEISRQKEHIFFTGDLIGRVPSPFCCMLGARLRRHLISH